MVVMVTAISAMALNSLKMAVSHISSNEVVRTGNLEFVCQLAYTHSSSTFSYPREDSLQRYAATAAPSPIASTLVTAALYH
jgi:hypothetical protein